LHISSFAKRFLETKGTVGFEWFFARVRRHKYRYVALDVAWIFSTKRAGLLPAVNCYQAFHCQNIHLKCLRASAVTNNGNTLFQL